MTLSSYPSGLAQDPKVVRDRWLVDRAARRKVARPNRPLRAQLAKDREPGRVGCGVEEPDVGVDHSQQPCGATSCA